MPSRSDFQWIFACNRSACLNCYRKISSTRWKNRIKYVKLILLRSRRQQNYRLCETGEFHQKAGQKRKAWPAGNRKRIAGGRKFENIRVEKGPEGNSPLQI